MFNEKILDNFISQSDPLSQICTKEYIEGVFKFGSFLSIIRNKKINPNGLFVSILENKHLREIFIEVTHSENMHEAMLGLLQLYPTLVKSKNTKRIFKKSLK
jgi:hypothetical protein